MERPKEVITVEEAREAIANLLDAFDLPKGDLRQSIHEVSVVSKAFAYSRMSSNRDALVRAALGLAIITQNTPVEDEAIPPPPGR